MRTLAWTPGDFRPGQVVVTQGGQWDPVSILVRWATRSPWTHVFLVTGDDEAMEAWWPHGVRRIKLSARLTELAEGSREFRVLDFPGITAIERAQVVLAAYAMEGRRYDDLQAALFALTGWFFRDGPQRLVCSRFITAAFAKPGLNLFPLRRILLHPGYAYKRLRQLADGFVTPAELLAFSVLRPARHPREVRTPRETREARETATPLPG